MSTSEHVGHIRIEALLGAGGMGEVHRGFDEKLERPVAVKTLRAERRLRPEAKARFLREARLLSRLDHPGICRVFDLIEEEDADHLVLELVEGRTLADALREGIQTSELLRLFEEIARALAVAHREHIVHRDLKPENVMVTPEGRVKVLDFGIARSVGPRVVTATGNRGPSPEALQAAAAQRDWERDRTASVEPSWAPSSEGIEELSTPVRRGEATLLTTDGSVIGTVRYMSPEQAAGDEVTEASDMFSFGVMLQEALTGQPAYGDTRGVELLLRVYRAETAPISGLDPELEGLLRELRQVDPPARPTAEATADRLLSILDRPQRARRRRIRLAVAATVAAALVVAAGIAIHARLRAAERVAVAQRFAQQAEQVEWLLRAEHLSPPHDIRPAKELVRQRMTQVEAEMARLGRTGTGPGEYALGRAALSLGDIDAAKEHLEKAREAGYRTPESGFALGLALGRLYNRELQLARSVSDPAVREREVERVQRELRDPSLELLRESAGSQLTAPDYLEGLIALYEGRYDDGLAAVAKLGQEQPWFYEARLLEGDLHRALAIVAGDADRDFPGQAGALERAAAAYQAAAEVGRSDPVPHSSRCATSMRLISTGLFALEPNLPPERIDEGLSSCNRAMMIDPDTPGLHHLFSGMMVLRAIAEERHGKNPGDSLQRASEEAALAVALEPESRAAHSAQAFADQWRAYYESRQGRDPRAALQRSIEACVRVLELLPEDLTVVVHIGNSYWVAAGYEMEHGGDPRAWVERGERELGAALEKLPDHAYLWAVLGALRTQRATYERVHGLASEASYAGALEALQNGLSKASSPDILRALAWVEMELAQLRLAEGREAGESLQKAASWLDRAETEGPGSSETRYFSGSLHLLRAADDRMRGTSPQQELGAAVRSLEDGLSTSAEDRHRGHVGVCQAALAEGTWWVEHGRSPEAACARGRAACQRALALRPDLAEGLRALALVELTWARWEAQRGLSPLDSIAKAAALLERATGSNPADAETRLAIAACILQRAAWRLEAGDPVDDDLAAGLEAAGRVLELNPRLALAELVRANLYDLQARAATNPTAVADARRLRDEARTRALELNPRVEKGPLAALANPAVTRR